MNIREAPVGIRYFSKTCKKKARFSDDLVLAGPCRLGCSHLYWDPTAGKYRCGRGF